MRGVALVAGGAVLLVAACDDGGTESPTATVTTGTVAASALVRGEYLVRSVAGCGECHTPRDSMGNLDESRWLAGVADRFDVAPDDPTLGAVSAPNLTPAGLGSWSDAQILSAMLDGVAPDGSPLFPLMPYYAYHNMTAPDAEAIVTYLRAVPAVAGTTPPRQPLPVALTAPAPPIDESAIPTTTLGSTSADYASATRGRYLAGEVGFCMDCHTPWRLGATAPLDMTLAFGGGRGFSSREWAVPPPAPAVVYSYNVTPDPTGISGWTAADVSEVLLEGMAPGAPSPLCRPMPSGPLGSLGALSAQDALDIGNYLTTLPPVSSGPVPQCLAGEED